MFLTCGQYIEIYEISKVMNLLSVIDCIEVVLSFVPLLSGFDKVKNRNNVMGRTRTEHETSTAHINLNNEKKNFSPFKAALIRLYYSC